MASFSSIFTLLTIFQNYTPKLGIPQENLKLVRKISFIVLIKVTKLFSSEWDLSS